MKRFTMTYAPVLLLTSVLATGCVTARPSPATEETAGAADEKRSGRPTAAETAPDRPSYDLPSLLNSVVRYQESLLSFDYFRQFVDGDDIFTHYLYRIYATEDTPYTVGQGSLLSVELNGNDFVSLQRALVAVEPDGSRWWQVKQSMQGETIEYAVLVHPYGVPLRIRYRNPESGEMHERITMLGESLEQALTQHPPELLRSAVREEVSREMEVAYRRTFRTPEVAGEETVEVPAGRFRTVHVRDLIDSGQTQADYWLSSDVPGCIVKIEMSRPGTAPALVGVLADIPAGIKMQFPDTDLSPEPQ
ncbi:hypothetical protein [Salinispira pacifica]